MLKVAHSEMRKETRDGCSEFNFASDVTVDCKKLLIANELDKCEGAVWFKPDPEPKMSAAVLLLAASVGSTATGLCALALACA